MVLISRGLDLNMNMQAACTADFNLHCSVFRAQTKPAAKEDKARWSSGQDGGLSRLNREFDSPTGHQYAPLAQLVEHLTLNQGVHGSSP